MKTVFEPALADEVIQLASGGYPERLERWRSLQDKVYEQPVEKRQDGFYLVQVSLMEEWRLDAPVTSVTSEFRVLDGEISEFLVARARSRREEGADLSWDGQRVGVKLCPERFLDPHSLEVFLRHEFMHISDMLDRAFDYRLEPLDLTPSQEAAARERYGFLWDISIESRLARCGKETTADRDIWQRRFATLFAALPEERREAVFQRLWDEPLLRHQDIMEKAVGPEKFLGTEAVPTPRTPGAKCPLCHFPTFQWVDPPTAALAVVLAEFPRWKVEEGMCPRCSEYYAIQVGVW
ncbi:MAG: hypothetical protein HY671_06280 [Chloroflexi bacterium]|nr:hypothetical protein [Chloroflexota bacterium]